ncbi:MAG: hypothetical protein ACTHUY_08870 [Flaviflexus sp.]|uniref:hypothetical protein n=1 Tax=Flaviflexus sp. TaxID=1969482 RepID=UPI003F9159EC
MAGNRQGPFGNAEDGGGNAWGSGSDAWNPGGGNSQWNTGDNASWESPAQNYWENERQETAHESRHRIVSPTEQNAPTYDPERHAAEQQYWRNLRSGRGDSRPYGQKGGYYSNPQRFEDRSGRWTIERVLRIITTLIGIGMVVFFFYNYIRISNMFGDFGMTFGSESAPTVITDLVGESHDVSLDGYLTV